MSQTTKSRFATFIPRSSSPFCAAALRILGAVLMLGLCAQALLAQGKERAPRPVLPGVERAALQASRAPEAFNDDPVAADESQSIVDGRSRAMATAAALPNIYGTFSVQNFQGTQNPLQYTHASAAGFSNFLQRSYAPNFLYRDSQVAVWAFRDVRGGDNYDLWSSTSGDAGVDAVRVAYLSTHGITQNRVFMAAMGANWSGRGWMARSDAMALGGNSGGQGDERLRYLFLDTCLGVIVQGNDSPNNTWALRANGLRMIFGYHTESADSPYYGQYFWEEWNKGKSFSQAFLDASMRISRNQTPAVAAFGRTRDEAQATLQNERTFSGTAVMANYTVWRWTNLRSMTLSATAAFEARREGAEEGQARAWRSYEVAGRRNEDGEVLRLARALGVSVEGERMIQARPMGMKAVVADGATLIVEANGNFELNIDDRQTAANEQINDGDDRIQQDDALIAQAQELAEQLQLMTDGKFQVTGIRTTYENAGTEAGVETERALEKTVILSQVIDSMVFSDPNAGQLEISFASRTGRLTRLRCSYQKLGRELSSAATRNTLSLEEARQQAFEQYRATLSRAEAIVPVIVKDSESIGYHLIEGQVIPVYSVLLQHPDFLTGRPAQIVIRLVK